MEPFVYNEATPHLGGNIDGGDSFTYSPELWSWLVESFDVKSVLDIGCAQGHALEYFRSLGCNVLGIEGLQSNVNKCKLPAICLDIQATTLSLHGIDLVWCCEVAEHIEEQYVDNLLKLVTCGHHLAMTYAEPNQDGHHHVNCQPESYWIEAVSRYGMVYNGELTAVGRAFRPQCNHFGWHGLIFERKEA